MTKQASTEDRISEQPTSCINVPSRASETRLSLFQGRLENDRDAIRFTAREFALIAILALHRRSALMSTLAGMLWPEIDEQAGGVSVRVTIYRLRRKCGSRSIIQASSLGYAINEDLAIDSRELEENVAVLRRTPPHLIDRTQYERLHSDISRPLPDVLLRYECFSAHLVRLERLQRDFLLLLAHAALAQHDDPDAISLAGDLIQIDPYNEEAYGILITAHLSRGNEPAAQSAFRDLERVLAAELDAIPSDWVRSVLSGAPISPTRKSFASCRS